MSYGFSEQKEARRRMWRVIRWLFATVLFLFLGVTSYWTGSKLAVSEVSRLQQEVDELARVVADLDDRNTQLQAQAAEAGESEARWRARYEAEVPTGNNKELLALIERQIEKGADPDRVAFLVNTAADERSCDGNTQTKRFLVRTPLYTGANDAVTFARNTITVTAQGESASNAEGKPEAWFDPAKTVTLRFFEPGGASSKASGALPLHHSVVRGDGEYRFSIVAGEKRGFIGVTIERCAFP